MSYIKKTISTISFVLIFGAFSTAAFAFNDVAEDEYAGEAILYLQENEVVQGYDDDTFRPNQPMNRAEFLKILMESAGISPAGINCFIDVKEEWFAGYACEAKRLGIVEGYDDETFRPANTINFAEASKIVVNVLEVERSGDESGEWFEDFVLALEANSAIPENVYYFGQDVTRGQMAEIMWRLLEKPEDVVTAKFDDLDAGKITVPAETALPEGADLVFTVDFTSSTQRANLEKFMARVPEWGPLWQALEDDYNANAGSRSEEATFDKAVRPVLDAPWKATFGMEFVQGFNDLDDILFSGMDPDFYFIVQFQNYIPARIWIDLMLTETSRDSLSHYTENEIEYWTDVFADMYGARVGDIFIFTNTEQARRAAIDRVLAYDGFALEDLKIAQFIQPEQLVYLYLSDRLVDAYYGEFYLEIVDDTGIDVDGVDLDLEREILMQLGATPEAMQLDSYQNIADWGLDLNHNIEMYKSVPLDNLMFFMELPPIGGFLDKFGIDPVVAGMDQADVDAVFDQPMGLALYSEGISDLSTGYGVFAQLDSGSLAAGREWVRTFDELVQAFIELNAWSDSNLVQSFFDPERMEVAAAFSGGMTWTREEISNSAFDRLYRLGRTPDDGQEDTVLYYGITKRNLMFLSENLDFESLVNETEYADGTYLDRFDGLGVDRAMLFGVLDFDELADYMEVYLGSWLGEESSELVSFLRRFEHYASMTEKLSNGYVHGSGELRLTE